MIPALYITSEGFRYHHKRWFAHCRQHVALFCSHDLTEWGPRLTPSLGASSNTTPQPDGMDCTLCCQDATLGCRCPPLHHSGTLRPLLGVWVQLSRDFWLKNKIVSNFLESCASTFPVLHPFAPAGHISLKLTVLIILKILLHSLKLLARPFGKIHCAYLNNWTKPS